MTRMSIAGTAICAPVLCFLLSATAVHAQEPRPHEATPPPAERPEAQPEAAERQEEAKPERQEKENRPDEAKQKDAKASKNEDKKNEDKSKEEKSSAERGGQETHARPAGKGGHIPDDKFRAHFGREHKFTVNKPVIVNNQPQFRYSGYTFIIVDAWPMGWAYTDDCYIDYIDGEYFLFDLLHPGVQVALFVQL